MLPFDPDREKYISLATFRKNGKEVRTPVWVAEQGGTLYVFSEGEAGKVKRIRANGRVSFAACNINGKIIKSDWTEAAARLVDDPAAMDVAYKAFSRKYGLVMTLTNLMSRLTGRYDKRAMIAIDIPVS